MTSQFTITTRELVGNPAEQKAIPVEGYVLHEMHIFMVTFALRSLQINPPLVTPFLSCVVKVSWIPPPNVLYIVTAKKAFQDPPTAKSSRKISIPKSRSLFKFIVKTLNKIKRKWKKRKHYTSIKILILKLIWLMWLFIYSYELQKAKTVFTSIGVKFI